MTTGIVVNSDAFLCVTMLFSQPALIASATVQGYLAPDN